MKWTIHSKESPMECYLRLAAITDPAETSFWFAESHFFGTVGQDSFDICYCDRPSPFRKHFHPFKIKGRFVQTANGTDIVLHFRPHLPKWLWWLLPGAILLTLVLLMAFRQSFEQMGEILSFALAFLCLLAFFLFGMLPSMLYALKILKSTFR